MDTRTRSLLKSFSWRAISFIQTIVIVYIFTSDILISSAISIIGTVSALVLYYLHERGWNIIKWGVK